MQKYRQDRISRVPEVSNSHRRRQHQWANVNTKRDTVSFSEHDTMESGIRNVEANSCRVFSLDLM